MKLRPDTRILPLLAAFVCALLLLASSARSQQSPGAFFAISDGRGQVSLLWFPPPDRWPLGGWRLEDSTARVIAERITMGDATALGALPANDAAAIRKLPQTLATPADNPNRRRQLLNILGLRAFSEPEYARALGLSWTLQGVAPGARTYKATGLDAAGQPSGVILTSAPVDASVVSALPPAPGEPRAQATRDGVSLLWTSVPEDRQLPVIAYDITRDSSGQQGARLGAKPLVLGTKWDPKIPVYLDRGAPLEEMLTYHIMSVDVFGRHSAPADIRILLPDFGAIEPPQPVLAKAGPKQVTVTWNPSSNPHTAGYVVERAYLFSGPYEALTPQGLPASTKQYEDTNVRGGTAYYYRLRSVGPRGDLGTPSQPAMAQPGNPGAPPAPANLKADMGKTRVRLTWDPAPFPVAGYFVERLGGNVANTPQNGTPARLASNQGWVRLNARVNPEPLYDDFFGATSNAKFSYRVVAVGFDNAESQPSSSVDAILPDTSLPPVPVINQIDGTAGKVTISFAPGLPEEKTTQFLVLRGGGADDVGVVIGDPLPGTSRRFEDLYVQPGESYWYRLVSVDKNGSHSDPSRPVVIRVAAPQIPTPAQPTLQFAKDPYPQVQIKFAAPPAGTAAFVETRIGETGKWIGLAGPTSEPSAVDSNPPASGRVFYRIYYRAANGSVGAPSPAAELTRP